MIIYDKCLQGKEDLSLPSSLSLLGYGHADL